VKLEGADLDRPEHPRLQLRNPRQPHQLKHSLANSDWLTGPAATGFWPLGSIAGGQTAAHALTQVTFLSLSGTKTYSVRPWALTNTGPTPAIVMLKIFTAPVAGALVAVLGVDGTLAGVELVDLLLEPPHPAMTSATTARTTGSLLNEPPYRKQPKGHFRRTAVGRAQARPDAVPT
jgi:hypothetical protein